ncbi:hypothetical protein ETD86_13000 [Nonomuraea turkmeniaca]|uniref:Uncharacterized protein n=1 Tax=Nonomuraea turkmeniaca TaxID=103838 RepID=A0A5S4G800_9ACTN|nr:hypothetical protein [Nonomuraea turkmeniaca]TMR22080.1 hypothetical protein ETD86_13000 [Nonomuraea turkmeniaca]
MPEKTEIKVSKAAGQEAIEAIIERRQNAGDAGAEHLLHDDPTENPLPVLNHLLQQRHHRRHLITDADVLDALLVLGYIRSQDIPHVPAVINRLEHELLELGRALKIPLIRLAEPLGLRSAQAVDHRILRARAAANGLPRNERVERAHRLAATPDTSAANREARWYDRNALKLYDTAGELIALRRKHDELLDDDLAKQIIDLARAHREMVWPLSPDSYPTLRWMAHTMLGIVEDLEQDYEEFRAKAEELLPEMAKLARGQHHARFGS